MGRCADACTACADRWGCWRDVQPTQRPIGERSQPRPSSNHNRAAHAALQTTARTPNSASSIRIDLIQRLVQRSAGPELRADMCNVCRTSNSVVASERKRAINRGDLSSSLTLVPLYCACEYRIPARRPVWLRYGMRLELAIASNSARAGGRRAPG